MRKTRKEKQGDHNNKEEEEGETETGRDMMLEAGAGGRWRDNAPGDLKRSVESAHSVIAKGTRGVQTQSQIYEVANAQPLGQANRQIAQKVDYGQHLLGHSW